MTIGCYILTNSTNNKMYVGQSKHIEKRLIEHKYSYTNNLIHKAIKKYGFNSFKASIWECLYADIDELEEFLIAELSSQIPNGYNISSGGYSLKGIPRTQEHNAKIGTSNKGKVRSEETKEKLRQANLGKIPTNKGKTQTLTPEQKAKHRLAMDKLKKPKKVRMTKDEAARYMSENYSGVNHSQYGKPKTEETREKISRTLTGNTAWNKGKPMSEESKRKLSESQKVRLAKLRGQ